LGEHLVNRLARVPVPRAGMAGRSAEALRRNGLLRDALGGARERLAVDVIEASVPCRLVQVRAGNVLGHRLSHHGHGG
jgi:hypothetical protein